MLSRIYHGPADWLVNHTTARDRRAFGFWTLIFAVLGSIILTGLQAPSSIWFIWLTVLSVVALIPNITAETPVEHEVDIDVELK